MLSVTPLKQPIADVHVADLVTVSFEFVYYLQLDAGIKVGRFGFDIMRNEVLHARVDLHNLAVSRL